jgi:hypothetical protein
LDDLDQRHPASLGEPAIKVWAEREIFGDNVAMEVLRAVEHYGDVILSAKFDGTHDKTGLPDPLILILYFTLREGRIARLIILHNKPVSESGPFRPEPVAFGAAVATPRLPGFSNRAPATNRTRTVLHQSNLSSPAGLQLHRSKLRVADPGDAREEVVCHWPTV